MDIYLISGTRGTRPPPPPVQFLHFHACCGKNLAKQVYIPVGCVPPTCWPHPVVSERVVLPGGVCQGGVCPRGCLPRGCIPACNWADRTPPPSVNRITGSVKTLPCPRLRLRVVIIGFRQLPTSQGLAAPVWEILDPPLYFS